MITEKENKINTPPSLLKADVIKHFGQVIYSCQQTNDGTWWHTIITKKETVYIEEFDDDILATIFGNTKAAIGLSSEDMGMMLTQIKQHLESE